MRIMILLGVLGLVYLAICLLVYLNQARLVYYPERELNASPADVGLVYEEVTLTTEDGLKLHAWFVPASAPRGTVLFCHGNAGNISHRIYFIRFLNELGLSVLIFDYRGFGRSEGKPSEAGTYADALAAWRHLVRDRGIGEERLLLFGRSIGAAVAIAPFAVEVIPLEPGSPGSWRGGAHAARGPASAGNSSCTRRDSDK